MGRTLDIVVTHYNEPWPVVRPFFDVLGAQRGVDWNDFKVWFIQDGPCADIFPKGYLETAPFQFEWVTVPKKGVSAARNEGIRRADSEWICFCDCDDSYSSIYSLKMIFYTIQNLSDNFDLMWNQFYMNYLDKDYSLVKQGTYNHVWIHNKYYRLSFLRDHDIWFCEDLYMSEDSAFNNVVEMEIDLKRIGTINTTEPLYSWCRRPGSITMDPNRYYKNIEGHFRRNLYVLSEYEKRRHARSHFVAARTVTDAWAFLTRYPVCDEFNRITEMVAEFYNERPLLWDKVTDEVWKLAKDASDKEASTDQMDIPGRMSLEEYIERLKEQH